MIGSLDPGLPCAQGSAIGSLTIPGNLNGQSFGVQAVGFSSDLGTSVPVFSKALLVTVGN